MHITFFSSWSTSFSLLLQIFSLILLLSEDSIKNNGFDRLYTRPFQFNNKLRDRQERKTVSGEKNTIKKKVFLWSWFSWLALLFVSFTAGQSMLLVAKYECKYKFILLLCSFICTIVCFIKYVL